MFSSSVLGILRKKSLEVLCMADPVDEFAVQQPKESDGTKPKSTTKEDLEADTVRQPSVELNSFKRETDVSRSNGMDGDVAELHADLDDRLHQLNIDPMRVDEAMQQLQQHSTEAHSSTTTTASNNGNKQGRQEEEEKEEGERRKGESTGAT